MIKPRLKIGLLIFLPGLIWAQSIRVGAKNFNEGYLLSEIISKLLEFKGYEVERKFNLGGTLVCFSALENGEIDIYPEYSGTISEQILKSDQNLSIEELRDSVAHRFNLNISRPYGFNNTYALAVRQQTSHALNLQTISDLRKHPDLNFAFSYGY